MKTLEQHNSERYQVFEEMNNLSKPHTNGIKCPRCGEELWDTNPMVALTSNPPQKNIHCPGCGYVGYRLA